MQTGLRTLSSHTGSTKTTSSRAGSTRAARSRKAPCKSGCRRGEPSSLPTRHRAPDGSPDSGIPGTCPVTPSQPQRPSGRLAPSGHLHPTAPSPGAEPGSQQGQDTAQPRACTGAHALSQAPPRGCNRFPAPSSPRPRVPAAAPLGFNGSDPRGVPAAPPPCPGARLRARPGGAPRPPAPEGPRGRAGPR